jgi:hypothetical protein
MAENGHGKKKAEILQMMKDATPAPKPRRARRRSAQIVSKGNQNWIAGGDININRRQISRKEFTPGPGHISAAQAKTIKDHVDNAVSLLESAGKGSKKTLYPRWWKMITNHFQVTTYREIPRELGDAAIVWVQQRIAQIAMPAARRTNNSLWRNQRYRSIWARSKELGMDEPAVHSLVAERLGRTVDSLKVLGERDLDRLYRIIFAMPRRP